MVDKNSKKQKSSVPFDLFGIPPTLFIKGEDKT